MDEESKYTRLFRSIYATAAGDLTITPTMIEAETDPEFKRAFLALQQARSKASNNCVDSLYAILDAIPLGVQINDLNGTITYSNKAHREMVPTLENEVVGSKIWDMQSNPDGGLKEYLHYLINKQPTPAPYFNKNKLKDGKTIDIRVDWNYLRNDDGELIGFVSVITDITEKNRIEQELRESEDRYRTLTSILPVGVFHTDIHGNTVFVNDRLANMREAEKDELLGGKWIKYVHPDDRRRVYNSWKYLLESHREYKIEYRMLKANGGVAWFLAQAVPEFDEQGKVQGFIGTITDITRLRETEEQLRQHQNELAYRLRLNAAGEMATSIAHELNQPLAAIVHYTGGCVLRLKDKPVSREIIEVMNNGIIKQAARAGDVIHRLKDFLFKGELQRTAVDVNSLIINVLELIKFRLFSKKIDVNLSLVKNLPKIEVDKVQLEQVILNLVSNAIDAMLVVNERGLQVSTQLLSDDKLEIVISDTGQGIEKFVLDNLFKPFITTKEHGMGIGLSISKSIIEAHNGTIAVESKLGCGAKFRIILPLKVQEEGG